MDEPHAASRTFRFTDPRPPLDMRQALERQHMVRFAASMADHRLELHGSFSCNGLPCSLRLAFLSAHAAGHDYELRLHMSWAHMPPAYAEYFRKSSQSWFDLWCQDFPAGTTPHGDDGVAYAARVAEFLAEDALPYDVPTLQRKILDALRAGATYSCSHKEGGTILGHAAGRFFRRDYGENPREQRFADETAFLACLRRHYDMDLSRNAPSGILSEEDAWYLISVLMNPPR